MAFWDTFKDKAVLHLKPRANESDSPVKVHVSNSGSLHIDERELVRNPVWRRKAKELIDADLTGRNKKDRVG